MLKEQIIEISLDASFIPLSITFILLMITNPVIIEWK